MGERSRESGLLTQVDGTIWPATYVEATSNTVLGAELVMILLVGDLWRDDQGLRQVDYAAAHRAPGVLVEEHQPGAWTFRWKVLGAPVAVTGLNALQAMLRTARREAPRAARGVVPRPRPTAAAETPRSVR